MNLKIMDKTMKNILIVNGHEYYEIAHGKYNSTLVDTAKTLLEKEHFDVKTTIIQNGYDNEEEINKFLWADIIIFQFPKYWMSIPAAFKEYLDNTLSNSYGKLYAHDGRKDGRKYGHGGLITDKKYMFSITMNAPKEAFDDINEFFEGKSVDELFLWLHKAFQFLGFKPLKTFICHDVMTKPNIQEDKDRFIKHLQTTLNI